MIALLAAVPFETTLLRQSFGPCEVLHRGRRDFYIGSLLGHSAVLVHSGVGKAAAAAATTVLLEHFRPSSVLVVGCGGAYPGSGLRVGDLVLATEEIYGDEGALTPGGFIDLEGLGLPTVRQGNRRLYHRFLADRSLLEACERLVRPQAEANGRRLACGTVVTVSTCSGTDAAAAELAARTGGVCENMEGAAVAQVCALHSTPFLEIRGISNLAEDRDVDSWDLSGAAQAAQLAAKTFLGGWPEGKRLA